MGRVGCILFGECVDGQLCARDIRERLQEALPDDVFQMLTQIFGVSRLVAEEALDCISDEIMMAAKGFAAGEAMWLLQALPVEIHDDVRNLATETLF